MNKSSPPLMRSLPGIALNFQKIFAKNNVSGMQLSLHPIRLTGLIQILLQNTEASCIESANPLCCQTQLPCSLLLLSVPPDATQSSPAPRFCSVCCRLLSALCSLASLRQAQLVLYCVQVGGGARQIRLQFHEKLTTPR